MRAQRRGCELGANACGNGQSTPRQYIARGPHSQCGLDTRCTRSLDLLMSTADTPPTNEGSSAALEDLPASRQFARMPGEVRGVSVKVRQDYEDFTITSGNVQLCHRSTTRLGRSISIGHQPCAFPLGHHITFRSDVERFLSLPPMSPIHITILPDSTQQSSHRSSVSPEVAMTPRPVQKPSLIPCFSSSASLALFIRCHHL